MSKVILVVDLGYGDSGKGTMVDFLAKDQSAHTVVRFNGGAQAAHNVVLPNGKRHTFAQFGAGTLQGASTFLSRFVLVDPEAFFVEGEHLRMMGVTNVYSSVQVDAKCLVVTPFHKAANRILERARGTRKHGSCGMGIGEAMSDMLRGEESIRVEDLTKPNILAAKLEAIQHRKCEQVRFALDELGNEAGVEGNVLKDPQYRNPILETFQIFGEMIRVVDSSRLAEVLSAGITLFEGAQGVLLDEWYGFHPYTTWSTTTPQNANTLLTELDFKGEVSRLGVIRSYATRHGNGPFVTEDRSLKDLLPEPYNLEGEWQGDFRIGYLDAVALRYAIKACGDLDALAVTHMDSLQRLPLQQVANSYLYNGANVPNGFEMKGERVVGFDAVGKNLSHQEALAKELLKCEPIYVSSNIGDSEPTNFFGLIEDLLQLPVDVASYGPTAADKRYLLR